MPSTLKNFPVFDYSMPYHACLLGELDMFITLISRLITCYMFSFRIDDTCITALDQILTHAHTHTHTHTHTHLNNTSLPLYIFYGFQVTGLNVFAKNFDFSDSRPFKPEDIDSLKPLVSGV